MKYADKFFMKMAFMVAEQSTCISKKVGAVLVKDNRVISIGYNGVPKGIIHCNEFFKEKTEAHSEFSHVQEVHAEMNALLYALKNGANIEGSILYCTLSPCNNCCKLLYVAGIQKIIYNTLHDNALDVKSMDFFNYIGRMEIKKYDETF